MRIIAPRPEISHLLFDASSQDGASGGQEGDQLLVELHGLANLIGLHRDVALGVDELGAERLEDRAGGVHAVGGLAETDAERNAGLVASLGCLQEGLHGPVLDLGWAAGRVHLLHVDAGMLLHQVDAGAGTLDLAAGCRGHCEPFAARLTEIFDGAVHLTVLLEERLHDVVERLEILRIGLRPPARHLEDVVTGLGLGFGRGGQLDLLVVAGDVVDGDFDLLLRGPFIDEIGGGLVGARHPMVPEADREFAGGVSAPDIGRCDQRRGGHCSGSHKLTSRQCLA
ncbi:hypothetical protein ABH979_004319 [Bradyrhizobium ottawaense]